MGYETYDQIIGFVVVSIYNAVIADFPFEEGIKVIPKGGVGQYMPICPQSFTLANETDMLRVRHILKCAGVISKCHLGPSQIQAPAHLFMRE